MKKGFTLIELLAVIVILAILALIAVPIILNIIGDTKKESDERSKELYLKAVEQAIARKNLTEEFNPSSCTVKSDGNLKCDVGDLTVEVNGKKPCSGTITFSNGKITKENIGYCDGSIPNEEIAYSTLDKTLFRSCSFEYGPIEFLPNGKLPEEMTEDELKELMESSEPVSEDGEIIFFNKCDEDHYFCTNYIYSENGISLPEDSSGLFEGFGQLTNYKFNEVDTSKVIDMSNMFEEAFEVTELDLSNFDTSSVTNMSGMFKGSTLLIKVDLSNFDTSNVTNMSSMFEDCSQKLTALDLSTFDTSKVTDMSGMFKDTWSLESIKFGEKFDTSKVTDMSNMFYNCSSLTPLNLSNFNTSSVTNMSEMFLGISVSELDLSSFDTSSVTESSDMFRATVGLTKVTVSRTKWTLPKSLLEGTSISDYTYVD